jgi:hypothetical protein
MRTSTAHTLVPGTPSSVHAVVRQLASRLWGVGTEQLVTSVPGALLVHGVELDGDTTCWLTWTFTEVSGSLTRVRLDHDDASLESDGPEPDLDGVLGTLLVTALAERSTEGTS